VGDYRGDIASGPIRAEDLTDLNIRYVTDEDGVDEMLDLLRAVPIAALDIETGKDREGVLMLRREQERAAYNAELIPVTPAFTAFEAELIGGDVDPAPMMPREELRRLRQDQNQRLITTARARAGEIRTQLRDAREGRVELDDNRRQALEEDLELLAPIAARWYRRERSYGLDPTEAVVRLIQVAIDHPVHGQIQFVVDAFHIDAARIFAELERMDVALIVFYRFFEMSQLFARYGFRGSWIDAREGMVALNKELAARGLPTSGKQSLLATMLFLTGAEMDKEPQTMNWNDEVLSVRQIEYAAADVRILPGIYVRLMNELEALGVDTSCLDPVTIEQDLIDKVHAGMRRKQDELHHVTEWAPRAENEEHIERLVAWSRTRRIDYPNRPAMLEAIDLRCQDLGVETPPEIARGIAGYEASPSAGLGLD